MIEVRCVCGKRYPVPDDKAGRKLQCQRCGAVQRVPRADVDVEGAPVIPFQAPGVGSDDGEPRPLAAAPLDLREPVRRCGGCGYSDDARLAVCVRCGHDFRTGRRLTHAAERVELEGGGAARDEARVTLDGLVVLARLCLTPLGLALGPWVSWRSIAVERALGAEESPEIPRIRAQALGGFLLWFAALSLAVVGAGRGTPPVVREDHLCRARLERAGAALRARLAAAGRVPAEGQRWPDALAALVAQGALSPDDLRCPRADGLYPFGRREAELLAGNLAPDYLLLWDREAHPDPQGGLVLRGLRADGRVEDFALRSALDVATRRPPYPDGSGAGQGSPDPGRAPATATGSPPSAHPGPPAAGGAAQVEAFLALAAAIDDTDPDFSLGVTIDADVFTNRVGLAPGDLLPALLERTAAPLVRVQAARALARVDLPRDRRRALCLPLHEDPSGEVRFGAAMCLRRLGEPAWLDVLVSTLAGSGTETRGAALRWLGREASQGPAEARRVLALAQGARARLGLAPDQVPFPLPEPALVHAAALVGDREVGAEARAALIGAGEAGLRAVEGTLRAPDREARGGALAVLAALSALGRLPAEAYVARVQAEADPALQAEAIAPLLTPDGATPLPALAWALGVLRAPASGDPRREVALAALARAGLRAGGRDADEGGLRLLLDDLAEPGDHAAVLRELAAPSRLLDERIEARLKQAWRRVGDARLRLAVVRLLATRPHEASQRLLLDAVTDLDPEVRAEALRGLAEATALRSDAWRRDAGRVVAQRLAREDHEPARQQLLVLAAGPLLCARSAADELHRCTPTFVRALGVAARKDRHALQALLRHPSEAGAAELIDLLATCEIAQPAFVLEHLFDLTGLTFQSTDPAAWRQRLSPLPQVVERRFEELGRPQMEALRARGRKAEQRLEAARAAEAAGPRR